MAGQLEEPGAGQWGRGPHLMPCPHLPPPFEQPRRKWKAPETPTQGTWDTRGQPRGGAGSRPASPHLPGRKAAQGAGTSQCRKQSEIPVGEKEARWLPTLQRAGRVAVKRSGEKGGDRRPRPQEPYPHLRSPAPTAGRGRLFEQEMLPEREWGLSAMREPPFSAKHPQLPHLTHLAGRVASGVRPATTSDFPPGLPGCRSEGGVTPEV